MDTEGAGSKKRRRNLAKGDIAGLWSISSIMSCHVMTAIFVLIELEIAQFDLPRSVVELRVGLRGPGPHERAGGPSKHVI